MNPVSDWYYLDQGEQKGPISEGEITQMIARGEITPTTFVWSAGMAGWEEASKHFAPAPPAPHPPPQPAPAPPALPPLSETVPPTAARTEAGPDGLYVGAPARSFGEAVSVCLQKYVQFSGRASRSEYWFFFLFVVLANAGASIVDIVLFGSDGQALSIVVSLGLFLPNMAVGWRRLHDTNRSGLWLISLAILAVVGGLIVSVLALGGADEDAVAGIVILFAVVGLGLGLMLLAFLAEKGQPHPNRYG